jgi:hypothetical protein
MSRVEVEMLEQIAEADGLYRTDVIRLLIRREHAKRFGSGPPRTVMPKARRAK